MSGYNHSGLTWSEYEARKTLLDAVALIEELWPHYTGTVEDLKELIFDLES